MNDKMEANASRPTADNGHGSRPDSNRPGAKFRKAIQEEKPLQLIGTVTAYSALLAKQAGFRAIYLSGAGVANSSFAIPDLGMTNRSEVLEDARRITGAVDLPLIVDIDTGWGDHFNVARTISEAIRAGVAGVHIEDQVASKRCGHRPGKQIVSTTEMVDRIKACVDGRTDDSFFVIARTDAIAQHGLQEGIERLHRCIEAGADGVFPEAVTTLEDYQKISSALPVPVLANITEFGKTPLFSKEELAQSDIGIILYPLSAFRAMSQAAEKVFLTIRNDGTQKSLLEKMQTREELYERLNYLEYEQRVDKLFSKE
jgi:methylisocitrate lyase